MFYDTSGSIRGRTFDALQSAAKSLASKIFSIETGKSTDFDYIFTGSFDTNLNIKPTPNITTYMQQLETFQPVGETNIKLCFDFIEQQVLSNKTFHG